MSTRLGVIGFGTMGCEIALLGALAGREVSAYDAFPEVFELNKKRLGKVLRMLSRDAKFFAADAIADDEGRQAVLARITTTSELSGLAGCTQVIEADTKKLVDIITKELAAELVRMEASADRKVVKIKADYDRYVTEKKADADLIAAQKGAEGNLLTKKAEAEGERLRNEAMQGVGGSIIVALEAAKNLNLSNVTISTVQIDLLDVDAMVEKLGVPPRESK